MKLLDKVAVFHLSSSGFGFRIFVCDLFCIMLHPPSLVFDKKIHHYINRQKYAKKGNDFGKKDKKNKKKEDFFQLYLK